MITPVFPNRDGWNRSTRGSLDCGYECIAVQLAQARGQLIVVGEADERLPIGLACGHYKSPYSVGPLDFPPGTRHSCLDCNSLSQQENETLRIDNIR
jgi:hypothetical protein